MSYSSVKLNAFDELVLDRLFAIYQITQRPCTACDILHRSMKDRKCYGINVNDIEETLYNLVLSEHVEGSYKDGIYKPNPKWLAYLRRN